MAGRPQVSIRLGTTGRADVERDFAAIGDSGEAQAKRYQAAWERASTEAERALERQAKAAARLEAAGASPLQQRINSTTGVGPIANDTGAARASAAAIEQQMVQGEMAARRLLASIDPLYAAQLRYDQALAEANTLQRQGFLTSAQLASTQTALKTDLDQQTALYGKQGTAIGNTRIAQMELMHVVRGSVDQFAAGAAPMQIFTMHLGMLGQAAALSGESMGKFGAFMSSGWGLALTVAVVALGPLVTKLITAGNSVDSLVEKLKKEAHQQAENDAAHRQFTNTIEGVTAALRDNRKALDDISNSEKTAARLALEHALAQAEKAQRIREATVALLAQKEAELKSAEGQTFGAAGGAGAGAAVGVYAQQVTDLQATLKLAEQAVADARSQTDEATRRRFVEIFSESTVDKIKKTYDDPRTGLIALAGKQATAEELVNGVLKRRVQLLTAERDQKIKEAEERDRKGPANAGGTAIFNEQIASYFETAAKYRGLSEHSAIDRGVLESFFKEANLQLDPEKTAWCAAFVNAVLATNGVKGTGSLAAKSFLTFGKDDTHSPQQGDIAVVRTKAGDHVGFVDSVDKSGNVKMLAGNTGDKVAEATYSKNQVLAIRRPPTPSESADAADKAANAAIEAQKAFDSEAQQLNQQYLQALAKVVAGYDAQATVQLMRAQGEHDAEAKDIASNLAAGKYGDATSQLAQSRAKQLQIANDQVLSERQAAIALDGYVKSLKAQDDANERDAKFKLDGLQYSESIARTAGQRRTLQLEIIEIEYKEKERHLQYLLALDKLLGNTEDAAKVAAELAHLPEEKARAKDQANRDTQTPFEAYRDSLPKNMEEAAGVMQGDVVDALKSLNDGLDDALLKSKSFHDLWQNMKSVVHDFAASLLKDLIDLTIKMMIIRPLMNLITGGAGGGTPGFATGTDYSPGGMAWVGEHGRELVRLPQGSKVFSAADSRRMAANDAGPSVPVTINIDATGADAAGLARVQGELQQLRQDLPGLVMETWTNANGRFWLRGQRR